MLSHLSMIAGNRGMMRNYLPGSPMGVEISNQGVVTYLTYGVPLKANVRDIDECCMQLPIVLSLDNGMRKNVFADPITSVIQPYCTRRVCNKAEPYVYRVEHIRAGGNEIGYLCSKGQPSIEMCDNFPGKLSIRIGKITSATSKLMSSVGSLFSS